MVVHNFHPPGVSIAPDKADPPLAADPGAVLAAPVSGESIQPVAQTKDEIGESPAAEGPDRTLNLSRRQFSGLRAALCLPGEQQESQNRPEPRRLGV